MTEMTEKNRDEWIKKLKTKNYQESDFLKSIFNSLEDYLNNKPSNKFECTDCHNMTTYNSIYHDTCYDCNVKCRMSNY